MNILIPMAGRGSRFKEQGYTIPKPFIDVNGKPMIVRVIENLSFDHRYCKYILLVLAEHLSYLHQLQDCLDMFTIVVVNEVTEGAACTCLLAEKLIDNTTPLLIANCDQLERWSPEHFTNFLYDMAFLEGCILTYSAHETPGEPVKNSYVKVTENGRVIQTEEKQMISDLATCGIYYWKRGEDFVSSAKRMISANDRCNGEFYVCPTYNYLIQENRFIGTYHIDEHIPIGTPEDLRKYLKRIY